MDRIERVGTLLVGGGVASVRCARTLRRLGDGGRILLVSSEPIPPYNRPPLSKELLRDELPDDLVMAEAASWYERRAVELRLGTEVLELDPDGGSALLADGTRVGFERCLLATGAEPQVLRVPGGEHALLLRTLPDARRLRAMAIAAGRDARVTVVGGGFIGVEVASGLAALGLRPTVIEMTERLWGGSLGDDLDAWARERLVDSGVGIRTGVAVIRLEEDGAWIGEERLDHAFCLAGIGVLPRTSVAEAAGLTVDDGIVVDEAQRSTHRSVWAAGDVARLGEQRVEHWHAAREAGERAARAMLGEPSVPVRAPWVFSEVAGRQIDVVGLAPAWDETRVLGDPAGDRFAVAFSVEGRIAQVAIVNAAIRVEVAREFVERRPRAAELDRLDNLRASAAG